MVFHFFQPLATIQPLVFSFSLPGLLSNPWFSTFTHPWLRFSFFSSLVYNISHPWFFTFFNPWLLFSPWFSTFTHPWLRFLVFLALFITYSTLGFSLFSTLGYYSALGFFFCPPLVIILPLVFSSSHPWLLFSPRFSTFPILGYYSALGFSLFPSLGCYPALGLYSAGESTYNLFTAI